MDFLPNDAKNILPTATLRHLHTRFAVVTNSVNSTNFANNYGFPLWMHVPDKKLTDMPTKTHADLHHYSLIADVNPISCNVTAHNTLPAGAALRLSGSLAVH